MKTLKDAAVEYAKRGWAVFPITPGAKTPLVKWRDESSTDVAQVEKWWSRWSDANIGLDCGKGSLFVVDLDTKSGVNGVDSWFALGVDSGTLTAKTPNLGFHLYYYGQGKNTAGKLGPGVDTRGEGGYVLVPPSVVDGRPYTWDKDCDIVPMPAKLIGLLSPTRESSPVRAVGIGSSGNGYGRAALDKEVATLASTAQGGRNQQLNTSAYSLGQLVAGGVLDEDEVISALLGACVSNGLLAEDGEKSVMATIDSGLSGGMQSPRGVPERGGLHLPGDPPWPTEPPPEVFPGGNPVLDKNEKSTETKGSTWDDMARVIGPIEWAWKPWLPQGLLVELVGESGSGKSILALRIAACFLRGDDWPDRTPFSGKVGKVLWCEAEAAQAINLERAQAWGLPIGNIVHPLDDPMEDVSIDNPAHVAAIKRWSQDPDIALIILDSLSGLHGGDEDKAKMMATVKLLAEIARDSGKPVILTHHLRKRGMFDVGSKGVALDRVRGSSAIVQTARVVWALDAPDENVDAKRMSVIKNNLARFPEPVGVECSDAGVKFVDAPEEERKETLQDKAADLLLSLLSKGPRPATELEAEFSGAAISWYAAQRAKTKLGIVSVKVGSEWKWSLPERGEVY